MGSHLHTQTSSEGSERWCCSLAIQIGNYLFRCSGAYVRVHLDQPSGKGPSINPGHYASNFRRTTRKSRIRCFPFPATFLTPTNSITGLHPMRFAFNFIFIRMGRGRVCLPSGFLLPQLTQFLWNYWWIWNKLRLHFPNFLIVKSWITKKNYVECTLNIEYNENIHSNNYHSK